ncbi:MAG: GIY-YIG nuclease family protein [Hyphomicrobium sp.]|nr:GIY-YIG nuclease family protein [Hyphomicrobium sp.]
MFSEQRKLFFVYITASKARGVLYVGMTSDLPKRAMEHRDKLIDGFTKKYWAGRIVYYEFHESADSAAERERLMKRWRRDWKIQLIETNNPTWRDLLNDILLEFGYEP